MSTLHWTVPSLMSSQVLEFLTLCNYLMITGTLLFQDKMPCPFHFICSFFSNFLHHAGSPASQGMNMASHQTHHQNSWVTLKGRSKLSLSQAAVSCHRLLLEADKISFSKRGTHVFWLQHHFCIISKNINISSFRNNYDFPLTEW